MIFYTYGYSHFNAYFAKIIFITQMVINSFLNSLSQVFLNFTSCIEFSEKYPWKDNNTYSPLLIKVQETMCNSSYVEHLFKKNINFTNYTEIHTWVKES